MLQVEEDKAQITQLIIGNKGIVSAQLSAQVKKKNNLGEMHQECQK